MDEILRKLEQKLGRDILLTALQKRQAELESALSRVREAVEFLRDSMERGEAAVEAPGPAEGAVAEPPDAGPAEEAPEKPRRRRKRTAAPPAEADAAPDSARDLMGAEEAEPVGEAPEPEAHGPETPELAAAEVVEGGQEQPHDGGVEEGNGSAGQREQAVQARSYTTVDEVSSILMDILAEKGSGTFGELKDGVKEELESRGKNLLGHILITEKVLRDTELFVFGGDGSYRLKD